MRNVILQEFVSLDGLAAGPDGSVDFVPAATSGDHSFGQRQLDFMDSIDLILLGRVTYQLFAEYWPNATGEDREFAEKLNAIPKVVFSKTLERAPWGRWDDARIVRSAAAAEVTKLKREPGKDMVIWGSISLAQSLIKEDLIDEYQLVICPMILGNGRPLFGDRAAGSNVQLLNTEAFDQGAVLLAYLPAHVPAGRS